MDTKIVEIEQTIKELLVYLEKYNDGEINYQISELKRAIEIISSNESNSTKIYEIALIQKNIYPPRDGLSDFYVWKNDEKERISINKPISELGDRLWSLLK